MKRSLIIDTHASSCYFRTSVEGDGRKALIQITERCKPALCALLRFVR